MTDSSTASAAPYILTSAQRNAWLETIEDAPKAIHEVYGSETLRCWLSYLEPGAGYKPHYHLADETFLVLSGSGEITDSNEKRSHLESGDCICISARSIYGLRASEDGPLVLFGVRAEAPGGSHIGVSEETS